MFSEAQLPATTVTTVDSEGYEAVKTKVTQQPYQLVCCSFTISSWLRYYDKEEITILSTESNEWWRFDH